MHVFIQHAGGLPSIQDIPVGQKGAPPTHVMLVPLQWSPTVQFRPSLQAVVDGAKTSAGHVALVPVQCSCTSHTPADERHTVEDGAKASGGHSALVPVQYSGTSHTPTGGRHKLVSGAKVLMTGQVVLVPSQVAAMSHTPAAARQTVPTGLTLSMQVPAPLQVSSASQRALLPPQAVPAGMGDQPVVLWVVSHT